MFFGETRRGTSVRSGEYCLWVKIFVVLVFGGIILCDRRDAPWHVSCGASVRSGEYCLWVKIFVVLVSAVAWHVWRYTQKHPLYVACIEGGEM